MGSHKRCCKNSTKISCNAINAATKLSLNGFEITRSGVYEICENVRWKVSKDNSRAITIRASNVTLVFKRHYLKQVDHTVSNTAAIVIASGAENVSISGGSITEVSGQAILLEPGSKNININEMTFSFIGYKGSLTTIVVPVFFVRQTSGVIAMNCNPDDEQISHVTISNCTQHRCL